MLASFTPKQRVKTAVLMAMLACGNDPKFIAWADAWFAGTAGPLSWPPTIGRQFNSLCAVEATMMLERDMIEQAETRAADSLWISMIMLGDEAQHELMRSLEAAAGAAVVAVVAKKRRA